MPEIINSVDRAMEILIYLQREGKETGISKIASDLDIYKSTVYRTLVTLEQRGFVTKNPTTEKYWLGYRLCILGKSLEERLGLDAIMRPYAKKLYDLFHEVVNISVLDGSKGEAYRSVIILKEQDPQQILTVNPPVGSSNQCYCSSVGKCLLAFGEDIDLTVYEKEPMEAYTEHTITTLGGLKAELQKVRAQGYAMDCEELEYGLTCIGAPILDRNGYAMAAISLSGPSSRMLGKDIGERIEAVRRAAREIAKDF